MSRVRAFAAATTLAAVGLVALAFAGTASAAAPVTHPLPTGFLGITPNIQPNNHDLDLIHDSGSTMVRRALSWVSVQDVRGEPFDWRLNDQFIARASRAGLAVDLLVSTTPPWAISPHATSIWHSPLETETSRNGWTRFIRAAVKRYGRGGTFWTSHPTIQYRPVVWTIWNEPNLDRFWATTPSAADFAKLMNFTGPLIRGEDHSAEIVAGGVFCQYRWDVFLEHFYRTVNKSSFDDLAIHPYNISPYGSFALMRQTRQIMDTAGDRDAGIWVDEISWGTDTTKKRFVVPLAQQAENIRILFQILAYQHKAIGLDKLLWYGIRDTNERSDCQFCASSGLWEPNGTTPKPSWFVVRGFARAAAGSIRGDVINRESKAVAGQRLYLDLNDDDQLERGEPQRATASDGSFVFPWLYATRYQVRVLPQPGLPCAQPASCSRTVDVKAGQTAGGQRFVVGKRKPPPPPPPEQAPDTEITKAKIKSKKRKAKFKFHGIDGVQPYTFQCKLDKKHWKDCESPKKYKHLKRGKHKFKVRAVNPSGLQDPTPAIKKFKVKRKHHHHGHHHHHHHRHHHGH